MENMNMPSSRGQHQGQHFLLPSPDAAPEAIGTATNQRPANVRSGSGRTAAILVIGAALGIVIGIVGTLTVQALTSSDEMLLQPEVVEGESASLEGPTESTGLFEAAVRECGRGGGDAVKVLDDGATLVIDGRGEDDPLSVTAERTACLLNELDVPQSVVVKMDGTRALDGRQSASWGNIEAEWTYHPDAGLDLLLTTATK